MDYFIFGDSCLLCGLSCQKFQCINKFFLTFRVREKFMESQHLVQLISELITLSPGDEFVRPLATQFERAFRCESVLWGVNHV